ncbi:MAG: amidase [Ilumatobacteraceae bacterium]|jgi:aspartyl-tRNA(Asn)/glutamyl-tRNA(Gln) amidotransferase subunit A|nr:amidase [Ilumatobacteraceae bacterium]
MLEELAAVVRSGALDPVDLVNESLRRIDDAKELNAVVALYADEALAAAKNHSREGALAGLPFLVKDMARVKGHVTTSGSRLYANGPADDTDDTVVARLRAAGAIVLGRTNSPEFGATAYTSNPVYGATRNPWNTTKAPGGSSGGSAAALAAGLTPLATTSDGGGSVRGPAASVGLVGYKPTMGAIGRNILPRWIEFSTQGTTNATVADVVYEASVTLGEARGDFLSVPRAGIQLTPQRPTKVLACRTFRADVDPEIEEHFENTLNAIAKSGIPVERVDSPSNNDTIWNWFIISTAELTQSLRHEEHRWNELSDYVQQQLKFGSSVTIDQYIAAQRFRHEVSARFDDILVDGAVLVTPTANARSWPAEGPLPTHAGNTTDPMITLNTPDNNFTGHPAVSVPMGLDNNGVPCGFQVISARFQDGLSLGLAEHLERIQPWPLVAPGYERFSI